MTRLSHNDACRLSRLFNEASELRTEQDIHINEWLKTVIKWTKLDEAITAKDVARGRQLTPQEKLANLTDFLSEKQS